MIIDPSLTHAPWTAHLGAMDSAISTNNASAAVLAWRPAYAAALDQPGWRGLVEVAGAALRIGAIPGFRKAAESRARESYWTALFRARRQGSDRGRNVDARRPAVVLFADDGAARRQQRSDDDGEYETGCHSVSRHTPIRRACGRCGSVGRNGEPTTN